MRRADDSPIRTVDGDEEPPKPLVDM